MIIGIDFDGTCVVHKFPEIGEDIGAQKVLRDLVTNKHQLILFTMRSNNGENKYLDEAVKWFKDNGIPLYGINENPTQHKWTSSPKPYCHLYIDDAALGCPLKKYNIGDKDERPHVDWSEVSGILKIREII